ncbi:tetratricopeptide repeat protein [Wenzhouxiangella marina]|uniref:Uncharacterized protein n=1 Tax=Wenzhouxiangella marina TaxID=1579979 RepID=A0A0K0XSG5_9GAMM|nr:tetratricopeptide repeat protein [Wenzhouxiangella marina]AKS40600.1 hypothetical protein WM2015_211 [Wenzhouxiangella marina]MBB6088368.1 TolB-like protein/lipoprotein NlpI [Wenzhouxiangella marina]
MRGFLQQLRRRKVLQSLAAYLVAAWLIVQVLDVVGPAVGLGDGAMSLAVMILAIGFPIVALISWFFEISAEGVRREREDAAAEAPTANPVFNYVIIAMLVAALGVSLLFRTTGPEPSEDIETVPMTLAVLPLQAMGEEAGQAGFVDGLHDDLLTMLSRISSLRVISRTSVMRFADGQQSIPEIGRQLGAGSILEGSVQRSGDRIRVNVQLIDASSDEHLWAEIFERSFDARAIFSIQREIARAIAQQLSLALTGEDEEQLQRQPTDNSEAYADFLLGRQRMARRTSESLTDAEAFFRRAIGHDPAFADAWAGLAEVIILQHDYAGLDRDTMQTSAMRAVQRALELAPQLARAHGILGELRRSTDDLQGAEESFLRAVELNPNDSLSSHWFGNLLYNQGRAPEALAWYQRAQTLDPLSVTVSNVLAQCLLTLGQTEAAAAQYERSLEIDPDFVATYAHLAQLQRFGYGRPDEAVRLLYQAYTRDPGHSEYPAQLAEALLELDAREAAARWAERATDHAADHWWPSRAAILVALASGDADALSTALDGYGANLGAAWLTLVARRDLLLATGQADTARQLFVEAVPDFFAEPPVVSDHDYYLAPALAVVLQAVDEQDRRADLLEAALDRIAQMRLAGFEDFDIAEVEALAMLGEHAEAIALLEARLDLHWLNLWWYAFDGPHLAALREEPGFQALRTRIEERMHRLRDGLNEALLTPPESTTTMDVQTAP